MEAAHGANRDAIGVATESAIFRHHEGHRCSSRVGSIPLGPAKVRALRAGASLAGARALKLGELRQHLQVHAVAEALDHRAGAGAGGKRRSLQLILTV
jgi:hypothetical protein